MEDFPEGYADVEDPNATHSAADPPGRDDALQTVHSRLSCGIEKKIVIAPITDAQRTVRYPRQERQYQTDLETQNNIENDTKLC